MTEPPGPACEIEGEGRFFPVVEGASWTYEDVDLSTGLITRRTQTIGPMQAMEGQKDGVFAAPQITQKEDGSITNWQEDTGTAVVTHLQQDRAGAKLREDLYVDYKLRLDESPENLVEGATYSQSYTARTLRVDTGEQTVEERVEDWEVVVFGEEVSVPAGTFCAMQLTRQRTTNGEVGDLKQYWFVRGVGKIKERAGDDVEELVDYSIP